MGKLHLTYYNNQAPGDFIVMTAVIRDIYRNNHNLVDIDVQIGHKDIFVNNPYLIKPKGTTQRIKARYNPSINQSHKKKNHFITGFLVDTVNATNNILAKNGIQLEAKLTEFKPDLHLSEEEKKRRWFDEPYWLIGPGYKADFPLKAWPPLYWQQLIDMMNKRGIRPVQIGKTGGHPKHYQPTLRDVIDLTSQTSLRDVMRLIYHAECVICHVTCYMHITAAFNKPCIVIAGGREGWWWEAYTRETRKINMQMFNPLWKPPDPDPFVPHKYLHTIGKLSCCADNGCWRHRSLGHKPTQTQARDNRKRYCYDGVTIAGFNTGRCFELIKPDMVMNAVEEYIDDGYAKPGPSARVIDMYTKNNIAKTCAISWAKKQQQEEKNGLTYPVTICVLLYGDYTKLHHRVIESIFANTNRDHMKLIVGCNSVTKKTINWLYTLDIDELIISERNIFKYPMMRRMFEKVDTDWIIWFDDDSYVIDNKWLDRLSNAVASNPRAGIYGHKYWSIFNKKQIEWAKAASWYKGVSLEKLNDKKWRINFITGGFWAIQTKYIRELDWPDPRINHNGGDTMLSYALIQMGLKIQNVRVGIRVNQAKRRGYSELPAGM